MTDSDITARHSRSQKGRAFLCLALALAATAIFTALAGVISGTSTLGQQAESGESGAILLTTLGYAGGVISALMALLLCIKPVIEDRGRQLSLIAGIISILSPLTAASLAMALGIR